MVVCACSKYGLDYEQNKGSASLVLKVISSPTYEVSHMTTIGGPATRSFAKAFRSDTVSGLAQWLNSWLLELTFVRVALLIVILHIVERVEGGVCEHVVALSARIVDGPVCIH